VQNLCGGFLWHAPARATIGEKFPDRMGFSLGVHAMGGNIAQTVAPLAVGLLLGFASWRTAYKLTLIPGILTALFLWTMLPQLKQSRGKKGSPKALSYLQTFRVDFLRNTGFLGVTLVAALRSVGESMIPVFLPLYLSREIGMSTSTIGLYLASLTLVGTIGAPAMGYFSDRWGRKPTLFGCLLTGGILIALTPVTASNLLFLPLTALAGLALFAVGPIIQASALEHTSRKIWGSAQTFMDVGRSVFALIFPLFAGLIADHYGLRYVFYLVGASSVLGAVIILLVPSRKEDSSIYVPKQLAVSPEQAVSV
jgi:MFS family permease